MIFSPGPITEVGRVIKTHGYEGNLRFEIFNSIDINLKEPIFMMFDHKPVPFFIIEMSKSNPYIVSLTDVNTLEHAQSFLNKSLYLPIFDDTSEEEDSYIGFEVSDTKAGLLGPVTDVQDNGAQDLLVVNYNGKELLIPFVEELLEDVNEEKRTIIFNLPEGLI
jgi:16S rRNA processing protein RimM